MPESTEEQKPGFSDFVVDDLAMQVAQQSVSLAMARAQLKVQAEQIERLAQEVAELNSRVNVAKEFPAPSLKEEPKEEITIEHDNRVTRKKENSAA